VEPRRADPAVIVVSLILRSIKEARGISPASPPGFACWRGSLVPSRGCRILVIEGLTVGKAIKRSVGAVRRAWASR